MDATSFDHLSRLVNSVRSRPTPGAVRLGFLTVSLLPHGLVGENHESGGLFNSGGTVSLTETIMRENEGFDGGAFFASSGTADFPAGGRAAGRAS
jgi:hypothetical protein